MPCHHCQDEFAVRERHPVRGDPLQTGIPFLIQFWKSLALLSALSGFHEGSAGNPPARRLP
ncbi:hypothetical protein LFML04_2240 [Leptospirillum ferriphilum ML-04]|uniref:Uncharacterized protein n=1 Tax=Leptospirillum ferriphilum (strain ML-04) TaxID=1048260 RepID=J9ZE65_LEPFM|nr:hypothetical protein LFML04_2240 [Leptospirillum ferriphilum ML-04]